MKQFSLKSFPLFIQIFPVFLLILMVIFIGAYNMSFLPFINRASFIGYGFFFEICTLTNLIVLFVLLLFANVRKITRISMTIGLILWIVSASIDVADEIYEQPLWLSFWGEDLLRSLGMGVCSIGMFLIIKEVSETQFKLYTLATIDELTGVANRRFFRSQLCEYEKESLIVFLMDLDYFKQVNDNYGHEKGDSILEEFGRLLLEVQPKNAMIGRLGGEEFAMFITSDDKDEAHSIAMSIRKLTQKIKVAEDRNLTVSIGCAYKHESDSTRDVMRDADLAMYAAKSAGRNCITWYN